MKRIMLIAVFLILSITSSVFATGDKGTLSGTVVDKDSGKAIANAFITVEGTSNTYTTQTDAHGFFAITGVVTGIYNVAVESTNYQITRILGVNVSDDMGNQLIIRMSTHPTNQKSVEISTYQAPLQNYQQVFTNYGYTAEEIKSIFPGPAGLQLQNIYETLPGVVRGFDPYYGTQSPNTYGGVVPHVRGGTGNDVGYAIDGIPVYEGILQNGPGTGLTNVGTLRTDFYVGGYPVQYGNFLSGYINQVIKRGEGDLHGDIQYQYGTWLDQGRNLPSYNTAAGTISTYNGSQAYTPTNINIELSGKDRKFGYYFDQIIQDGGVVQYPTGVDVKPLINNYGGLLNSVQARDTVVNLTYGLNPNNDLQLLLMEGIRKNSYAGPQELQCNPAAYAFTPGACLGSNTQTGFGETFNPFMITPLQDRFENASYDLEKFEFTHRFDKPGSTLTFRLWEFNPTDYLNFFNIPNQSFWSFQRSAETGILLEHQNQLSSQHLLDVGASFIYSKNTYLSAPNNIGAPAGTSSTYLNATERVLFSNTTFQPLTANIIQVPNTQNWSAWINDEWRPTPKWLIQAGIRWDQENYALLTGSGIVTSANGAPFVSPSICPVTGFCYDPGRQNPSLITPRIGTSYELSDKLTMKASYGKFGNFSTSRREEAVRYTSGFAGSSTFLPGIPVGSAAAFQLTGSNVQSGESLDVSWVYKLNDTSSAELTPYIKHIVNPLQNIVVGGVPITTNAGTIESKGIEFLLKTKDWHGLDGWLSYTYGSARGTQLPFVTDLTQGLVGMPGSPFTQAQVTADKNTVIPTAYDQRHTINLDLSYKIGKWEFAPNFTYGSGYPYGIGANQLRALAALMDPNSVIYGGANPVPANSSAINPLGETTYNSLRMPGWWLGNLAITYHMNASVSGTLSIFNLWNSKQVIDVDSSVLQGIGYLELTNPNVACCYTSNDFTKNILPQYNPLRGQYAPIGYPSLRQFFFTLDYKY